MTAIHLAIDLTRPLPRWHVYGRWIAILFAGGWFLTGLLYAYAGIAVPVAFDPRVTASPEALAKYFGALEQGALFYLLAFACFAAADFALLLLGVVLRQLVGPGDIRGELMRTCMVIAMAFGILVDVMLFSHWLIISRLGTALAPAAQAGLWTAFLEIQTFGVWLSVAGYVIGALGLLLLATATIEVPALRRWALMTFAFAFFILLEVAAIVFDVAASNSGIATGLLFLLLTVVVAPIWALWLARLLGRPLPAI
ncbi:MAG: hypothetical protein WDN46_11915 [Methylocella sp.]